MPMQTLKEREKEHLLAVLEKTHWNLSKTACLLRISLKELEEKMRDHELKGRDSDS
jgi:DNA-binding NtrC family response regulator